jgi:hypothetical protein
VITTQRAITNRARVKKWNRMQKEDSLYNLNDDDNSINRSTLSLKSEKSKIYTFTMYTISVLLTGRIMCSIKYDSKKQFKF